MILVGQRKISKFIRKHPNAKASLERWVVLITKNDFDSFSNLTFICPSADYVRPYTVFNIGGNNYQ